MTSTRSSPRFQIFMPAPENEPLEGVFREDIFSFCRRLSEQADETGLAQVACFKGFELRVEPGQPPLQAFQEWARERWAPTLINGIEGVIKPFIPRGSIVQPLFGLDQACPQSILLPTELGTMGIAWATQHQWTEVWEAPGSSLTEKWETWSRANLKK
jgi:hypothetical protein